MAILITGAAGFIGFHTALELVKKGYEVIGIDNFNDYYDPGLKKARANELKQKTGVNVLNVDVSEYKEVEKIFEKNNIDKVFHSAAQAGVRYSIENPFAYENTNFLGTLNVLELCRKYKTGHFVLSSSSSVYGKNNKLPFSEEDRVDCPISVYAATKKSNEELCFTYSHLYGIKCTCLRFFTVYGPWGRPDMALFKFTKKILENKPIPVFNQGKLSRDFTYISDIVEGVLAAIEKPFEYEIFNLARGKAIPLMDFISALEDSLWMKSEKEMLPMQPGDMEKTSADITKAGELLGYKPKISIEYGVNEFVKWYKNYHGLR
ncbi:MAG: SDR family NAD(P)-dependent oxidoreductase [Candidatus Nanoarchaeia archaeon]